MTAESLPVPISDESPCGEDLDFEEDAAYFQFTSVTEALLPDSYLQEDDEGKGRRVPFYMTQRFQALDLAERAGAGARLLERTHDLRLLAIVAKLQILDRGLAKFEATVATMAALLETYWDEVHPRAGEGRTDALERLAEPLVLAALNNATLFRSRRFGMVTWVSYQAAVKGTGETPVGTENVDRILRDEVQADASSVIAAQELVERLQESLRRILSVYAERQPAAAPNLQRLTDSVAALLAILDRVHPREGATEATGAPAEAGPDDSLDGIAPVAAPSSSALPLLPSAETAEAALAEAVRFFAGVEPSSPSLLLLQQAQALVGRSFFDAMRALMPDHADKAALSFGTAPVFSLPLKQIVEAVSDATASSGDEAAEPKRPVRAFTTVTSRAEALALLDQVSAFYRFVEPSSPIPMLVDRSRSLAGRDFSGLLKILLPETSRSD